MKDNYKFNGRPGMGNLQNSVKWASIVNASANTYKLDPNFLGAIIEQESGWNLKAKQAWSNQEGSGFVYGLGQIQDVSLTGAYSNYKDGDQSVQIPLVARFLAMKQKTGSKSGVTDDYATCNAYNGGYGAWYYNSVEKKKAIYEQYDIPVSQDAKGQVNTGTQPTSGGANATVSWKTMFSDFKTSIVSIPNKLMAYMGVSMIGLIAIVILISQAKVDNNEEL